VELLTIGHSNHSFDRFLSLLKQHGISMLVDVRSQPHSRFPHFQREALIQGVRSNGIDYRFGGNVLGGKGHTLVTSKLFISKMDAILVMIAEGQRVVLMCSEGKPEGCHRAGKLTAWVHRNRTHIKTTHILPDGSTVDAREYEPQVSAGVWWHEFEPTLPAQAELAL
jgi:uncharacterized protein (DUF488 family)